MPFMKSFNKIATPSAKKKEADYIPLRRAAALGIFAGAGLGTYGALNQTAGDHLAKQHAHAAVRVVQEHGGDLLRAKGNAIYQRHRDLARQGALRGIRGKRQILAGSAMYLGGIGGAAYAAYKTRKKAKK
jgi:hypothetical protein